MTVTVALESGNEFRPRVILAQTMSKNEGSSRIWLIAHYNSPKYNLKDEVMTYPKLAQRTNEIQPFHAMSIFDRSIELARQGRDIISLGIGEPDFTAAPEVKEALKKATDEGLGRYSPVLGIWPLREAIAQFYAEQFGASVEPNRVIITSGASAALLTGALMLLDPGDEILMPDPCYPPNVNFATIAGATTRLIPTSAENRFQPTPEQVMEHWGPATRGILLASPGNPAGTCMDPADLARIIEFVRERGGFVMMDEIYLGLTYTEKRTSALAMDDNTIILNSFSKYFHMTGWRLGWMIVPAHMVKHIEQLTASIAICANTLAQHAALACFTPSSIAVFEQRRQAFQQRRDYLVKALEDIGLKVPAKPDGAFYIYADISRFSNDSDRLAIQLLEKVGVAVVPGKDFGPTHAKRMIRLAYTIGLDRLEQAVQRMNQALHDLD